MTDEYVKAQVFSELASAYVLAGYDLKTSFETAERIAGAAAEHYAAYVKGPTLVMKDRRPPAAERDRG